jgi:hypothetical protein
MIVSHTHTHTPLLPSTPYSLSNDTIALASRSLFINQLWPRLPFSSYLQQHFVEVLCFMMAHPSLHDGSSLASWWLIPRFVMAHPSLHDGSSLASWWLIPRFVMAHPSLHDGSSLASWWLIPRFMMAHPSLHDGSPLRLQYSARGRK